jgi:hypothetical protein
MPCVIAGWLRLADDVAALTLPHSTTAIIAERCLILNWSSRTILT